jgi:RES domain-containing protein
LACLEILVHLRPLTTAAIPAGLYYSVEVPEDRLEVAARAALPAGWDAPVAGRASRDYGMAFLRERRAAGLVVPTVVAPLGSNVVLNPLHPTFHLAWVKGPFPFACDQRLIR